MNVAPVIVSAWSYRPLRGRGRKGKTDFIMSNLNSNFDQFSHFHILSLTGVKEETLCHISRELNKLELAEDLNI